MSEKTTNEAAVGYAAGQGSLGRSNPEQGAKSKSASVLTIIVRCAFVAFLIGSAMLRVRRSCSSLPHTASGPWEDCSSR